MTTQEIFEPLLLNGLFAAFGSFASIGAQAVGNSSINDVNNECSPFQQPTSTEARRNYLVMFFLAPFVFGSIWGLLHEGFCRETINEYITYAIAMLIGVVANKKTLEISQMKVQELSEFIKNILK